MQNRAGFLNCILSFFFFYLLSKYLKIHCCISSVENTWVIQELNYSHVTIWDLYSVQISASESVSTSSYLLTVNFLNFCYFLTESARFGRSSCLSFSLSLCIDLSHDTHGVHGFIHSGLKGRSRHTINVGWCLADHVVRQEDVAPHEPASDRRSLAAEHLTVSLSLSRVHWLTESLGWSAPFVGDTHPRPSLGVAWRRLRTNTATPRPWTHGDWRKPSCRAVIRNCSTRSICIFNVRMDTRGSCSGSLRRILEKSKSSEHVEYLQDACCILKDNEKTMRSWRAWWGD